ncbi:MAG: phosphonoacetaldehyde reductase [Spirochaetes bacterium]|nr:phosphonoacetaldehyde reductase [Spirochaetota bacterium]MBN2770627.1 phosphonoacetaldehyde reductase [Spirochaetota bacterium]
MTKKQHVITDKDGYKKIDEILQKHGSSKFLLVCSKRDNFVKQYLRDSKLNHVVFSDFQSNPLYKNTVAGVSLFNKEKCDFIIAIGGGSAIDIAKCVKLFCKMDDSECYIDQQYLNTEIPLMVLPTTAGAGSEATRYAVIYRDGVKQSVTHESIVPDYVILEPAFLATVPDYHKKSAMLDALCQAIESMWSVNSTEESRDYSRNAIKNILKHYKAYLSGDKSAASDIMYAAYLSGKAINITQTTAAHAMSYKLTSLYRIAHGHAVALCLPHVWSHISENRQKTTDPRGADHLENVLNDLNTLFGTDSTLKTIEIFSDLLNSMELRFFRDDIDILVNSVNPDRLKNNPVNPGTDGISKMYKTIMKEIIQ